MSVKLITIVGITGTQGASVADSFLNESGWKIRGVSRDPSKDSSKVWSDKGVEMVAANLDDAEALKKAFKGSNAIFGVTDFWQQFKVQANHKKAKESGRTVNEIAFDIEVQQGKNIVDAVQSTIETLDVFILSTLGDSRKWSKGKITWNYHFEAKWKAVEYLESTYPKLYQKSSFFQPASYITNLTEGLGPHPAGDGSYVISLPIDSNAKVPQYHARKDTGAFVKALVESTPGKNLMGYGDFISFQEVADIWSQETGKTVTFRRATVDDMDKMMPGGAGRELGEMIEYMSSPGYYGGAEAVKAMNLIEPKDLGKFDLVTVKDYLKGKEL